MFDILRDQEDIYTLRRGTAREVTAALKNSNNSNGLFVVKLALLGNKDASATVEWMLNVLYPGNIPSDNIDSIVRQERDLEIMKDPRYVEIFKMVDYSICGIEVDDEKPYSKTLVIRKNAQGKQFKRELSQDSTGVREFCMGCTDISRSI